MIELASTDSLCYLPSDEMAKYIEAKEEIEEYLNSLLVNVNSNLYRISSRIKSLNSVLGKLERKNFSPSFYNIIDNIHDISGIRVVFGEFDRETTLYEYDSCLENSSLDIIKKLASEKSKNPYNHQHNMTYYLIDRILNDNKYKVFVDKNGEVKNKDYIRNPKPSGYSSYHIILVASNGKCVEIQVRNLCQHLWSVLEHKVIYKNDSSVSPEEKIQFMNCANYINNFGFHGMNGKTLNYNSLV
jgi:ppGpp synthetase/RelA/SpoT-type nucleotidyltranferase